MRISIKASLCLQRMLLEIRSWLKPGPPFLLVFDPSEAILCAFQFGLQFWLPMGCVLDLLLCFFLRVIGVFLASSSVEGSGPLALWRPCSLPLLALAALAYPGHIYIYIIVYWRHMVSRI